MVANAHPELREWCKANAHDRIFEATQDGPGGIYEALHHFRWAPETSLHLCCWVHCVTGHHTGLAGM